MINLVIPSLVFWKAFLISRWVKLAATEEITKIFMFQKSRLEKFFFNFSRILVNRRLLLDFSQSKKFISGKPNTRWG